MTEQNYRIRIKQGEVEIEVEGDRDFVEMNIEKLKNELSKTTKGLLPEKATLETPKRQALGALSLAEFYKQKQPEDDIEVAMTIAYYLTSAKKTEIFANQEIKQAANKLGYKLSNPADTLRRAASGKKAYVTKIDKGKWALTV